MNLVMMISSGSKQSTLAVKKSTAKARGCGSGNSEQNSRIGCGQKQPFALFGFHGPPVPPIFEQPVRDWKNLCIIAMAIRQQILQDLDPLYAPLIAQPVRPPIQKLFQEIKKFILCKKKALLNLLKRK